MKHWILTATSRLGTDILIFTDEKRAKQEQRKLRSNRKVKIETTLKEATPGEVSVALFNNGEFIH